MKPNKKNNLRRRGFFKTLAAGTVGTALLPGTIAASPSQDQSQNEKPKTNVEDLKKYPRNDQSMPGQFPAKVVQVNHPDSMTDSGPDKEIASQMVREGMLALTGEKTIKKAWR